MTKKESSLHHTAKPRVTTCSIAAWRFAHFPITSLSVELFQDEEFLARSAQRILAIPEVLSFLNTLDGGQAGDRFERLRERIAHRVPGSRLSKSTLKSLEYCGQLILSSILRNDTGKKGSISLATLDGNLELPTLQRMRVLFPEPALVDSESVRRAANIHNLESDRGTRECLERFLLEQYSEEAFYRFSIESGSRLSLAPKLRRDILESQFRFGVELLMLIQTSQIIKGTLIVPFSIDYFIRGDRAVAFEVHCPPRTIEAMFTGFRPFMRTAVMPSDHLIDCISETYAREQRQKPIVLEVVRPMVASALLCIDSLGIAEAFQRRHKKGTAQVVSVGSGASPAKSTDKWTKLDRFEPQVICITDEVAEIPQYEQQDHPLIVPPLQVISLFRDRLRMHHLLQRARIEVPKHRLLEKSTNITDRLMKDLAAEIGPMIVVKTRVHEPWWSDTKVRTAFIDLDFPLHQLRVRKMVRETDLLVEELVGDSTDNCGHSGELRVFSVLIA